jgi:hypothetical protein
VDSLLEEAFGRLSASRAAVKKATARHAAMIADKITVSRVWNPADSGMQRARGWLTA